jgi:hypothetical protein
MRAANVVFAAGLVLASLTPGEASADRRADLRRELEKGCKTLPELREFLPSIRARICACQSERFSASLTAAELNPKLDTHQAEKAFDAALQRKSLAAMKRCVPELWGE